MMTTLDDAPQDLAAARGTLPADQTVLARLDSLSAEFSTKSRRLGAAAMP